MIFASHSIAGYRLSEYVIDKFCCSIKDSKSLSCRRSVCFVIGVILRLKFTKNYTHNASLYFTEVSVSERLLGKYCLSVVRILQNVHTRALGELKGFEKIHKIVSIYHTPSRAQNLPQSLSFTSILVRLSKLTLHIQRHITREFGTRLACLYTFSNLTDHQTFQMQTTQTASKGTAVSLQARSGPEGSRNLRFPDFMTTAQDGGKVVSLTHRPPLPPGNTPDTHFC